MVFIHEEDWTKFISKTFFFTVHGLKYQFLQRIVEEELVNSRLWNIFSFILMLNI